MLEQKQRQIWNLHEIPQKVMKPNFQFSFYYFHDRRSPNRNNFFSKILIFLNFDLKYKNNFNQKIENQAS